MNNSATTMNGSASRILVGVIGAGSAGLVTAQTLLEDGFDVQLLTRDKTTGGVWSEERLYPGLQINNVHGEYHFPPLPMELGPDTWLTGEDLKRYMQDFTNTFLRDRVRYQTEVLKLYREEGLWVVKVKNLIDNTQEDLVFDKIVLCTGGCSTPQIPDILSISRARQLGFEGLIFHSSKFGDELEDLLKATEDDGHIVIVGGGKSARDNASYLANAGRKVTVVYESTDAFLAAKKPLPNFLRRSRFLSVIAGHINLRTPLERFLHTTWLGGKITRFIWKQITESSFAAMSIPRDSPLRLSHSLFWSIRVGDAGVPRSTEFFTLANEGKIDVVAPARVTGYGSSNGQSITLKVNNGTELKATAVILATGFSSSWNALFDEKTAEEIGINRHPPDPRDLYNRSADEEWPYTSLVDPPPTHSQADQWTSSIYRGIVPAKNILKRDFAINGAVFNTHNGYVFAVTSHWISSYFLGDKMFLPDPKGAREETEREARFIKKRYPDILLWVNESYSAALKCWTWPQYTDELLEDMGLRSMRSGGNWLTWPFKVVEVKELATLGEERRAKREGCVVEMLTLNERLA
ncbi:FAD/NAD-P-binding domain-containing protein [Marasmius fiardii PR-910]|nr:FAD/NAD-P-binding domain-containing protein [Marasmius fiardii PR-910]